MRVAGLGIVVLVVGSLGPWAEAASRDGLLTLAAAAVAAIALWRRFRPALLAGATLALTVVLYDLLALDGAAAWGLWTALAGALILVTGATVARR